MKPVSTEEYKETIKALLEFVKSIAPQLQEVTKNREFELVITNDENGIGMSCSMGWDPMKNEWEAEAEDIAEGVEIDVEEVERITKAFIAADGDKRKTAEMLGLSERTLNRKLKEYRIELSKH